MDPKTLRSIPLFDGLSDKELGRIAQWTDEIEVPAGKHLLDQGRYAIEFFVLVEGSVEVRQDRHPIATLGPGDVFGEIGLLQRSQQRTATIETLSPCRAVVMDVRGFDAMMKSVPTVAERIREIQRTRLEHDR
jgi:CRP/FNR family cyclic AMP-dependent transcriptional regulator